MREHALAIGEKRTVSITSENSTNKTAAPTALTVGQLLETRQLGQKYGDKKQQLSQEALLLS